MIHSSHFSENDYTYDENDYKLSFFDYFSYIRSISSFSETPYEIFS